MARHLRGQDWALTGLGPIGQWSPALRVAVDLLLRHPGLAALAWGPRGLLLCNDGYARRLLGARAAEVVGRPLDETLPESAFAPHLAAARAGRTVQLHDHACPLAREFGAQDAWFDVTWLPVHEADGGVGGVLMLLEETTGGALDARRRGGEPGQARVERDRAQDALRESERQQQLLAQSLQAERGQLQSTRAALAHQTRFLEATLSSIPDFVYAFDRAHRFVYVNRAMQALFGLRAQDMLGRTFAELGYPPTLAARLDAHLDAILATGQQVEDEVFFTSPAGVSAYFEFLWGPVRGDDGAVELVVGVSRDTTQRRALEQRLRESEERLRLALEVGELGSWDWDLGTGGVVWSPAHFRMQGYAPGEVQPGYEAWLARVHPQDRAGTEAAMERARRCRQPYNHEFRTLHPDGSVHWLSAQGHFFYDDHGAPVRMIGVMRDVTEQRHARELLEQHVAERTRTLHQLLRHMETLQDEERRRIARELHDGFGQVLTSVGLAVGALRREGGDAARERVERLHASMQQLDRELDRMVFLLRPTALEDCGLADGVAAYVHTWSQLTGVGVDMALHGLEEGERLDAAVEGAVFRVVQEALNNVTKYARASRVSVTLARRSGLLVGSVEDDGVGFDAGEATAPGAGRVQWGLLGMQERVEALGGSFAIDSQPGAGTTVLWRLPLAAVQHRARPAAPL